ncbi:hypothetical protein M9H77_15772 [Catharanthus roseus]|uniref:Uncharacterized protein n=1 Tax=Catharanthus roseus TaxID=4058 RepID=A0ACC0AYG1_CATRO|nr:hypothetical protein M9H77_15772 [Catharanthus roseus]
MYIPSSELTRGQLQEKPKKTEKEDRGEDAGVEEEGGIKKIGTEAATTTMQRGGRKNSIQRLGKKKEEKRSGSRLSKCVWSPLFLLLFLSVTSVYIHPYTGDASFCFGLEDVVALTPQNQLDFGLLDPFSLVGFLFGPVNDTLASDERRVRRNERMKGNWGSMTAESASQVT